jgi:uncharacterized protein YggE
MNTQIQLTVADLHLVKTIIDTACGRGAFRADEMGTIGEFYNRLSAFLDALAEQAREQAESNAEQAQSTEGETE